MQEIKGEDRNIQDLLGGSHYGIDYYQREYKWRKKQLSELINDLTSRFLENYSKGHKRKDVAEYGHYFLGSIVVSKAGDTKQIVDGQQRLTTLTLLLIYLNNLQKGAQQQVRIESLICDDDFGENTLKLSIPERNSCMKALLDQDETFDPEGKSESVQNLHARYHDLDEIFSDQLTEEQLPLFINWLIKKVQMVEITAYADYDAYTIFETMNDRGLSLSPTDMLKGYLLAKIEDGQKRQEANDFIKQLFQTFAEYGKDTASDFFKAWLRAKYARKMSAGNKNDEPEDFELIGTEFHRWVKDNHRDVLFLNSSEDFYRWIMRDMEYFANLHLKLLDASIERTENLESVCYNADHNFTQQIQLMLAPAEINDGMEHSVEKARLVADYLDCWLNRRYWNFKSSSYSGTRYTIFGIGKEIRDKTMEKLREDLVKRLEETENQGLTFEDPARLNSWNSKSLRRQLARMVDWLEQQSGLPGRYPDYIVRSGKHAFEIEHIWADHHQRHTDEIPQKEDFDKWRNNIGGLLLLPKKVNASLSDMTYEEKQKHYLKENLLAQSLHETTYENNPGFNQAIDKHDLPFKPHAEFKKADLEERNGLYCKLAAKVWSIDRLKDD